MASFLLKVRAMSSKRRRALISRIASTVLVAVWLPYWTLHCAACLPSSAQARHCPRQVRTSEVARTSGHDCCPRVGASLPKTGSTSLGGKPGGSNCCTKTAPRATLASAEARASAPALLIGSVLPLPVISEAPAEDWISGVRIHSPPRYLSLRSLRL